MVMSEDTDPVLQYTVTTNYHTNFRQYCDRVTDPVIYVTTTLISGSMMTSLSKYYNYHTHVRQYGDVTDLVL